MAADFSIFKMAAVRHLEWEQIDQDVVHRSGQFRKRLSLVAATGGEHIEHRFDLFGATRTLSCLRCFSVKMQNLDNKSK